MLRTLLLVASVLMCLPLAPAGAQVAEGVVTASLLPGWRTARGTHMAALHLSLRDGWKTYWRAPGEGGIPPQFDWGGSQNARSVRIHWPTPEVFEANGMQSIGYGGTLVLPLEVATDDPGAPVVLTAEVSLGVCEAVCVPVSLHLSAELPPGEARRDRRILVAIGDRPETGPRRARAKCGAGWSRLPTGCGSGRRWCCRCLATGRSRFSSCRTGRSGSAPRPPGARASGCLPAPRWCLPTPGPLRSAGRMCGSQCCRTGARSASGAARGRAEWCSRHLFLQTRAIKGFHNPNANIQHKMDIFLDLRDLRRINEKLDRSQKMEVPNGSLRLWWPKPKEQRR